MSSFRRRISWVDATKYGREAVEIGENGFYISPSGRGIDLFTAIECSVLGTRSYSPEESLPQECQGLYETSIQIRNEATLAAAKRQIAHGFRSVVLNFASATSPGGGFLNGAQAQEEYLTRSTCLYHCIRGNPMYEFHRKHYTALHSDYALYSPEVPVFRADDGTLMEEPYNISVITAAAVNAAYVPVELRKEILPNMWRRILKVLSIGITHRHDAIVLGAWGCGAFANDPGDIALLFHKALKENFHGAYRQVVFAIADWSPERRFIGPFEEVFDAV